MKEILSPDSPLRKPFEEFVKKKFAVEALVLYDACVSYQQLAKSTNIPEDEKNAKLQKMGKAIVQEHFVKDAPNAFDVPGGVRTMLVSTSEKDGFQKHSFDVVCALAFNDLKVSSSLPCALSAGYFSCSLSFRLTLDWQLWWAG